MNGKKIETFMRLAGQGTASSLTSGDEATRKLGSQLLLSELLEYIIRGLGVHPVVNGVEITEPENIEYKVNGAAPDHKEMLDGLADVAYTMYWNQLAFGLPLEEAFELICDNNLEKFVDVTDWGKSSGQLDKVDWDCGRGIEWPAEVQSVELVSVDSKMYAVGKDARGKVRKPSSYKSVELDALLASA